MKPLTACLFLVVCAFTDGAAQLRQAAIHSRGMLHQTVFNTGEIGRAYDNGRVGMLSGYPSMEWPPNSEVTIDRRNYKGQHNSFGNGLWLSGTRRGIRQFAFCGAVSTDNGSSTQVEGVFSNPISLERRENYPLLPSGAPNPGFDPNEAEEIITAKWSTPLGFTVTRISRAWSYPGYRDFIIYEYEIRNDSADVISDAFVAWGISLAPSMFGYERSWNRWAEAQYRANDQFARYDLRRYMTYNHDRNGKPDSAHFQEWAAAGTNGGGLNSPQAAGFLILHYDYDHLSTRTQTSILVNSADARVIWDANDKVKQPYLNRYENGNVYVSKLQSWLDPVFTRKTGPFSGSGNDSIALTANGLYPYWTGRAKPSWTLGFSQPVMHGYGLGPYHVPSGATMRFAVAEVVGYGPGVASDSVFTDLGGGTGNAAAFGQESGTGFHPIPSWYSTMTYPYLGNPPVMGNTYLRTYPLPWYVQPPVISIRDVADRAIQMYTGYPLIKYDSTQFEPRTTPDRGVYQVPIPIPSPILKVENTGAAANRLVWGPQAETFSSLRLRAPLKYYLAMRAPHQVGPWSVIDTVRIRDPRFWQDSAYVLYDHASDQGEVYVYSVLSVDTLGLQSGLTNMTQHETQAPAVQQMEKVYAVPNPLIVTNGIPSGSDPRGELTDRIGFMGLPKRCTIRIFSFSGQLIETLEHDADQYSEAWFQVTRNNQMLASGVYFFVVDDRDTAKRSQGKFVIIR